MRPKPLSRMRGAFWTAAALYFLPDVTTLGLRDETVALVARHRLPAIYWHSSFVRIGGLACYGPDQTDLLADQAGQNLAQRPGDGTACSGYESRSARSHSKRLHGARRTRSKVHSLSAKIARLCPDAGHRLPRRLGQEAGLVHGRLL
jgi:hypothetical protein